MTTAKKVTAKKPTAKPTINAIAAQAGAIAITVQTKASARAVGALEPLRAAMLATGDETMVELLARLPQDTVAFQVFAQNAIGTAQLFAWFDDNKTSLTRITKEGKSLLNMSGAYCAAFGIVHDRAVDGPLKAFPFYKRLSNALQQWAKRDKNIEKRASGAITDAIASYLNKKEKEDSEALADSIVAWVLKSPPILNRIINSKAV